jgi:hypothetical protein
MLHIILELFFACVSALATVQAVRFWRRVDSHHSRPPGWWFYSGEAWRGFERATPTVVIGAWGLLVAGGLTYTTSPGGVADVLIVLASIPVVGSAVVAITVALVNRPRSVVPPVWRDEEGMLSAWRRSRTKD